MAPRPKTEPCLRDDGQVVLALQGGGALGADQARRLPEKEKADPMAREMAGRGCFTRMHVLRLLAPSLHNGDHSKDIYFNRAGIEARWQAGLADTRRALQEKPWTAESDPLEGFLLHELRRDLVLAKG